jgi:hypothetical protein
VKEEARDQAKDLTKEALEQLYADVTCQQWCQQQCQSNGRQGPSCIDAAGELKHPKYISRVVFATEDNMRTCEEVCQPQPLTTGATSTQPASGAVTTGHAQLLTSPASDGTNQCCNTQSSPEQKEDPATGLYPGEGSVPLKFKYLNITTSDMTIIIIIK